MKIQFFVFASFLVCVSIQGQTIDTLSFSHAVGYYRHSFLLEINNTNPQAVIFMSDNGDEPTPKHIPYQQPILVEQSKSKANLIANIPTNPPDAPLFYRWRPPISETLNIHTLRFRSFIDDEAVSEIYTLHFIVGEEFEQFNLPIVSLVCPKEFLFDHRIGIFVAGKHFEEQPSFEFWGTGNYHQKGIEWERTIDITMFSPDGTVIFHQKAGMRLHGLASRVYPQKSLRLYARRRYGSNNFEGQLFEDSNTMKFKHLILRNSGQDFTQTMLKDAFTMKVVQRMNLDVPALQPVLVFINGEFWGIQYLMERIGKHYFQQTYQIDAVDILELDGFVAEGTSEHYETLMQYVVKHKGKDMMEYEIVSGFIDIENFIDYNIAKIFFASTDWPGNNVKFWRPQTKDGTFRWLFFDNDLSCTQIEINMFEQATIEGNKEWPNPDWSTFLLRNLLQNSWFVNKFTERFTWHLQNTFQSCRLVSVLDELVIEVEIAMWKHQARWSYPDNIQLWYENIRKMKEFLLNRPCVVHKQMIAFFQLPETTISELLCDTVGNHLVMSNIYPYELQKRIEKEQRKKQYVYSIIIVSSLLLITFGSYCKRKK